MIEFTGAAHTSLSNDSRRLRAAGVVEAEPTGRYTDYRRLREALEQLSAALATPTPIYTSRPKATPGKGKGSPPTTHDRARRDRIDASGKITLRYQGRLYSTAIGRTRVLAQLDVLLGAGAGVEPPGPDDA